MTKNQKWKMAKTNVIGKQVTTWLFIGFVWQLWSLQLCIKKWYNFLSKEFDKLWIFEPIRETKQILVSLPVRLSKIFKTFNIRSDLNFSNAQNSRSEHIWTLNFSICFDSLRTANISDISNIFDTLARTDFWVELGWIGCAD